MLCIRAMEAPNYTLNILEGIIQKLRLVVTIEYRKGEYLLTGSRKQVSYGRFGTICDEIYFISPLNHVDWYRVPKEAKIALVGFKDSNDMMDKQIREWMLNYFGAKNFKMY
jgi:hypothetical protein